LIDTAGRTSAGRVMQGEEVFDLVDRSVAVFRTQAQNRDSSEFVASSVAQSLARRRRSISH
jgi:hypothetical protein